MVATSALVYISVDDQDAALQAMRDLDGRATVHDAVGPHFAYVDPRRLARATTFAGAMYAWRWLPSVDGEGNIVSLEFTGEKEGDEDILFEAIAPWVRDGSFVVAACEDGRVWRWLFQSGRVLRQTAKLSFDG
jgi:hypothetical protein